MPRSLTTRSVAASFFRAASIFAALLVARQDALAADPGTAECVALNEKAAPVEKQGKLLEARASFVRCSASTCPAVVRDDCARGAVRIDAAIPTVVFVVRDRAGNDLSAVTLRIDGEVRADRLTGVALDLDPGERVFRFEAAGLLPLEKRFVIHAAEKNRRELIVLVPASGATPAKIVVAPTPPVPSGRQGSPLRPAGLVVGSVGVAGLVVGGVFGLLAHSKWAKAESDCGAGCGASTPARTEAQAAHSDAKLSNILFAAAGGVAAAGLIMFLVAPSSSSQQGVLEPRIHRLWFSPLIGSGSLGLGATGTLP